MAIFSMILLLLIFPIVVGVELNDTTQDYIKQVVERYESSPYKRSVYQPDIVPAGASPSKGEFFLPDLIIWCPITTYNINIKCPTHGLSLSVREWLSSTKPSRRPRFLYGTRGNCLLIGRVYLCQAPYETHRLLSTDPDILRELPLFVDTPFILTHKSGCTKDTITLLCAQISLGCNFNEISRVMTEIQQSNLMERSVTYCSYVADESRAESLENKAQGIIEDFEYSWVFVSHSIDSLISHFLDYFEKHKLYYEAEMSKVKATSISMDHTFKICRNIGLERQVDKKWIRQYDCLFAVMNELGQIATWSLTKGTAFSNVEPILSGLRDRLSQSGEAINHAVVDNCCQWRKKLISVFGPGLQVKLDLFHAVQRFTQTLPKNGTSSTTRNLCITDFSLVFRQCGDMGQRREKLTPSPDIITQNLENFLKKWTGNHPLLNKQSMQAIENIKSHIKKGCLSGIPSGHGTERNENLHRYLNRSLVSGATRIGPELAFALLTILFYGHNHRLSNKKQRAGWFALKRFFGAALSHKSDPSQFSTEKEQFGFTRNSKGSLESLRGWVAQRNNLRISESESGESFPDVAFTFPGNNIADILTDDVCGYVVRRVYDQFEILGSFRQRCTGKNAFQFELLMGCSAQLRKCLLKGRLSSEANECPEHDERLQRHLASFNLESQEVPPDGDCLFRSVSIQLKKLISCSDGQALDDFLIETNVDFHTHLVTDVWSPETTGCLRRLFVAHASQNISKYMNFLNMTQEKALASIENFKRHGVFSGNVGDIVVLVLSDLLRCPIIVISSMEAVPMIPFIPDNPVHHKPIYIAFNHTGAGHYDATKEVEYTNERQVHIPQQRDTHSKVRCTCGKDKIKTNPNFQACVNTDVTKYQTRCPCFKKNVQCSADLCKCVNCFNGKPAPVEKQQRARKRSRKEVTKHKKMLSLSYLLKQNEPLQHGSWTDYETCLLESVLSTIDLFPALTSSAQNVHSLYNCVCSSRTAELVKLPVRQKSLEQVQGKLRNRHERKIALTTLIQSQLEIEVSALRPTSSAEPETSSSKL